MEKDYFSYLLELDIMEISKMIKNMEKEFILGQMVIYMKEIGFKIREKDLVITNGTMEILIKENG